MNNSWDHLAASRVKLLALKKIAKDADPASGVSFSVRCGVARDNEDFDGDSERRPWVTVEVSDSNLFGTALAVLTSAAENQIVFWESAVKRDIAEAEKILTSK